MFNVSLLIFARSYISLVEEDQFINISDDDFEDLIIDTSDDSDKR